MQMKWAVADNVTMRDWRATWTNTQQPEDSIMKTETSLNG